MDQQEEKITLEQAQDLARVVGLLRGIRIVGLWTNPVHGIKGGACILTDEKHGYIVRVTIDPELECNHEGYSGEQHITTRDVAINMAKHSQALHSTGDHWQES